MWDLNAGESFCPNKSKHCCRIFWKCLVEMISEMLNLVRTKHHAMSEFFGDRCMSTRRKAREWALAACPARIVWMPREEVLDPVGENRIVSEDRLDDWTMSGWFVVKDKAFPWQQFLGGFGTSLATIQDLHLQSNGQVACNTQSIGVNNVWLVKCSSPIGSNLSCLTFQAGTAKNMHGNSCAWIAWIDAECTHYPRLLSQAA